jgi:FixJ family two-component response regulator
MQEAKQGDAGETASRLERFVVKNLPENLVRHRIGEYTETAKTYGGSGFVRMTDSTTIVHVVDDDDSFRKSLMRLLKAAGYEARAYPSASEFILANPIETPGCVLLDVRMPGRDGFDLQDAMTRSGATMPVIFLTGHGDIPMSVRAMKAGAVDFLTKPVEREALLAAVRTALTLDAECRSAAERLHGLRVRFESLTIRERAVFDLVVAGTLNKQIAAQLGISERTVKAHRAQVMEKMHATSLADLVHIAGHLREGAANV